MRLPTLLFLFFEIFSIASTQNPTPALLESGSFSQGNPKFNQDALQQLIINHLKSRSGPSATPCPEQEPSPVAYQQPQPFYQDPSKYQNVSPFPKKVPETEAYSKQRVQRMLPNVNPQNMYKPMAEEYPGGQVPPQNPNWQNPQDEEQKAKQQEIIRHLMLQRQQMMLQQRQLLAQKQQEQMKQQQLDQQQQQEQLKQQQLYLQMQQQQQRQLSQQQQPPEPQPQSNVDYQKIKEHYMKIQNQNVQQGGGRGPDIPQASIAQNMPQPNPRPPPLPRYVPQTQNPLYQPPNQLAQGGFTTPPCNFGIQGQNPAYVGQLQQLQRAGVDQQTPAAPQRRFSIASEGISITPVQN